MTGPSIPDVRDPATAARLSGGLAAGARILTRLGLNQRDQAALLAVSVRSLQRAARGEGSLLNQDQLTRLSLVVGIFQALGVLYDDTSMQGWMHRPNRRPPFDGLCPFEFMWRFGIPGMVATRARLDTDRSGLLVCSPAAIQEFQRIEALQPPINLDEDNFQK